MIYRVSMSQNTPFRTIRDHLLEAVEIHKSDEDHEANFWANRFEALIRGQSPQSLAMQPESGLEPTNQGETRGEA